MGWKEMWLSLVGEPAICCCSVMAPVLALSPNSRNWTAVVSLTFAMTYTEPVFGSYTGVEVTPTFGVRSSQDVMWYALPSEVFQTIAPVVAFSPYTQSFSVATITVLPTTSGYAYTWPLTAVLKIWPNCPPPTAAWVSVGSFGSHPSRRLFCEPVVSSAAGPELGAA